jgi:hypothetical protein
MIVKSRYEISLICDICDDDDKHEAVFYGANKSACEKEIGKADWYIHHDNTTYCAKCNPMPLYEVRMQQAKERKKQYKAAKVKFF